MATYEKPLPKYEPKPFPPMEASLKIWLTEEFRRIMEALAARDEAIEELRQQNP